MAQKKQNVNTTRTELRKRHRSQYGAKSGIVLPTPEEWKYICNPEPELSYIKEQISKYGGVDEI